MPSTLAAPPTDRIPGLKPGESLCRDVVALEHKFETEAVYAERTKSKPRKGRLGRLTFEFKTADILNGNRRIYPGDVFKMAFDAFMERVKKNSVFGNLDHPSEYDPDGLIIRLSDACVKIDESSSLVSDTNVEVTLDILDNKHGQQLMSVLDANGNPGLSQRAIAEWREATEAERARFGVPSGEWAVVAKVLRLITYDVVSEPGFADAIGAKFTENQQAPGNQKMPFTLDQLKSQEPTAYSAAFAEGKAAAASEVSTKVQEGIAAQKPTIVAEALKPIEAKLAEATEGAEQVKKVLAGVKPAMVKLGLVNEQITDVQAAAQVATLTNENKQLKEQLEASKKEHADLKAAHDTLKNDLAASEAIKLVADAFKAHPHRDVIIKQVAAKKIADASKAMEAANGVAEFIKSVGGNTNGAAAPTNTNTNAGGGSALENTLATLLSPNHANANGNANGGNGGSGNEGLGAFVGSDAQFVL